MAAYHFFAVCPRTLEPILAQELQSLGAQNIKVNAGGVLFEGALSLAMNACLRSRYASRILLRIATRQYYDSHDIYDMAHVLPWERFFDVDAKIRVDITAHRSPLESLLRIVHRLKVWISPPYALKTAFVIGSEKAAENDPVLKKTIPMFASMLLSTSVIVRSI